MSISVVVIATVHPTTTSRTGMGFIPLVLSIVKGVRYALVLLVALAAHR